MSLAKHIVLITSGQPSLNPRLVKEADTLSEFGFDVTVIYQYWNDWATTLDDKLLADKKWKAIRIGGDPLKQKIAYWKTRLRQKIANTILAKLGLHKILGEYAIGRCTPELIKNTCRISADLYIAHNLAALPAAVIAAKKNKSKCGFDAEDLHRYEMSNDETDTYVKLKKIIEEKYFYKVDYLTTSSPQIVNQYKKLFPKLLFNTILNVSPKQNKLKTKLLNNGTLKLIWFSQNIGLSRGLQDVFHALKSLQEFKIEFHILGYLASNVKHDLDQLFSTLNFSNPQKIFFHEPIDPISLQEFINQFDIGLATEPAFSINNDSALSNKIFTYIQSGLAIIASNTIAQKQLLEEYPNMGMIYEKNNPKSLAHALKMYLNDDELLNKHQLQAYKYAHETLNWEIESTKFLSIIEKALQY